MKHLYILLIAASLLCSSLHAQVSGYRGKHFLLKSDFANFILPNVSGRNLTIEAVFRRKTTVSLGYQELRRDFGERYTFNGFSGQTVDFKNLSISDRNLFVEFRLYRNDGFPAPLGFFLYGRFGIGAADFEGSTFQEQINNVSGGTQQFDLKFRLSNMPGSYGEFGAGSQKILFDRLIIDFAFGFMANKTENPEPEASYLKDLSGLVGPNLHNFNVDYQSENGGFGFTAHVSAGLLLF